MSACSIQDHLISNVQPQIVQTYVTLPPRMGTSGIIHVLCYRSHRKHDGITAVRLLFFLVWARWRRHKYPCVTGDWTIQNSGKLLFAHLDKNWLSIPILRKRTSSEAFENHHSNCWGGFGIPYCFRLMVVTIALWSLWCIVMGYGCMFLGVLVCVRVYTCNAKNFR